MTTETNNEKVRFHHIRAFIVDPADPKRRKFVSRGKAITIASLKKREAVAEAGALHEITFLVGMAFCSKKDQFDRKKGKFLSERRLQACPLQITVWATSDTAHQALNTTVQHLLMLQPDWEDIEHGSLTPTGEKIILGRRARLYGPGDTDALAEIYYRRSGLPWPERIPRWVRSTLEFMGY